MRLGGGLVAVLLVGCEAGIGVGATCVRASDCPEPFVCLAQRCRVECREARDCPVPLACLALGDGLFGCRIEDEESGCTGPADCPSPLTCVDGVCEQRCTQASECAPGLSCDLSACTIPEPLVDFGDCDPTAVDTGCGATSRCALASTSFACVAAADEPTLGASCADQACADGLVCAGGRCVRPCRLPGAPGCIGTSCDGSSCGDDVYCDELAIGIPGGALPPTLPDGLGYCSERCDVFGDAETDGCPPDTACSLTIPGAEFLYWCRPLVGPFLAPYDPCTTSDWDCPLGTICEVDGGDPARLCREFCHPGSSGECAGGRPCVTISSLGIGVCGNLPP